MLYDIRVLENAGTAILLGLSAAVPIGPVNLEIMRRGLHGGFRPAVTVGLGAATVDGLYSMLFTLGFATLRAPWQQAVGLAGALLLVGLGLFTIRGATRNTSPQDNAGEPETPSNVGGYITGFGMTATNPMTLVFWASVGATLTQLSGAGTGGKLFLAAGVIFGALLWVFGFAYLLHRTRHLVSATWRKAVTIAGGAGIAGYGIRLLWSSL